MDNLLCQLFSLCQTLLKATIAAKLYLHHILHMHQGANMQAPTDIKGLYHAEDISLKRMSASESKQIITYHAKDLCQGAPN